MVQMNLAVFRSDVSTIPTDVRINQQLHTVRSDHRKPACLKVGDSEHGKPSAVAAEHTPKKLPSSEKGPHRWETADVRGRRGFLNQANQSGGGVIPSPESMKTHTTRDFVLHAVVVCIFSFALVPTADLYELSSLWAVSQEKLAALEMPEQKSEDVADEGHHLRFRRGIGGFSHETNGKWQQLDVCSKTIVSQAGSPKPLPEHLTSISFILAIPKA